jgi:2-amino-4-hydroxy-6-hydroxymethyldihydropteridine diphosphokinase
MMNNQPIPVYLSLGSNLEDRRHNLELAIDFLKERMKIEKMSSIYETEPVGEKNQPKFMNMCIMGTTRLSAPTLLFMAKGIEAKLGRVPIDSPRPIDIDIIFFGDQIINTPPQLMVPHPRMADRAFVLIPLAEIAPDMVHPVNKKSVKQMLETVKGKEGVKLYGSMENK